jgi:hypothetical protein
VVNSHSLEAVEKVHHTLVVVEDLEVDKVVGMVAVMAQLDTAECSAPKVDIDGAVDNIRIHTTTKEIISLTEST